MKTKAINKETAKVYSFFLLMVVPLLIGLFIMFSSLTHAEWDGKDESHLRPSPLTQGWTQFGSQDLISKPFKTQEKGFTPPAQ
ncbi:MAG: hypothetical protein K2P93_00575 [Alphaproteobacteria bacterium]|nr:hypothetical protein [Alphaproteobacteria bacterium]